MKMIFKMKKEFNGETWMLIILIVLSICSYCYLYENKNNHSASVVSDLEVAMKIKEGKFNEKEDKISNSAELIDQKIIKKSLEKIREWLPVN